MTFPQRPQPASGSPTRGERQVRPYRDVSRRRQYSDEETASPERRRPSKSPLKGGYQEPTEISVQSELSTIPSNHRRRIEGPPRRTTSLASSGLNRKRSLIRPERNRIDRDHPNYHYRQHAQNMTVLPSETGTNPVTEEEDESSSSGSFDTRPLTARGMVDEEMDNGTVRKHNRRSVKSEKRRSQRRSMKYESKTAEMEDERRARRTREKDVARVPNLWSAYCHLVTFWCPDVVLRCFGMPAKAQQHAWREKIGLISIILLICTAVGYITFGFSATVCPASEQTRLRVNDVDKGYLIIHGEAYNLVNSKHPAAAGVPNGANVLYDLGSVGLGINYGGMDASFMFQNVNGHCKDLITAAPGSDIPIDGAVNLGWYFPCRAYNQDGSSRPNETVNYYLGYACHLSTSARKSYYGLTAAGAVYYTWDDIKNSSRNLAVWGGDVLDLDLLNWFNTSQVSYPNRFDEIRENSAVRGADLTMAYSSGEDKQIAKCFSEIIKVGSIDTEAIGCIASKVVLYVSLIFILAVYMFKFVMALTFQWFLSRQYTAKENITPAQAKRRAKQIEDWSDDIYRLPPKFDEFSGTGSDRSKRASAFLPTTSRFTSPYAVDRAARNRPAPTTMASQGSNARILSTVGYNSHSSEMSFPNTSRDSRASMFMSDKGDNRFSSSVAELDSSGPSGFINEAVVPQPPPEWQPFGYPLAHAICLVTAYTEGAAGIRTTLDSIATTEYPNSHKIILVVCDGLVKGHGEDLTTPEIALSMMRNHTILLDEVEPFSYVAVASGSKRHNMAKVYSGFYDYGQDSMVPAERRERVPMMVIVKTGTPDELRKSKPGNRGKRDSQIILMSFLQKVMFDERMTELEYEMFNGIWKITGISADYYEVVLMVDADTKVFPDSMTHMVSAMVKDPEIMGLCGETKIANKRASWVSMIQVFEYFISHHLAKSFESVFGGVTCLPGCFSMYRIKAPKGGQNYWVPILANPDIVEHYSENVVDTLHKKNLLLLGEDRYLSTLMLKTFPKRKQVFVPQAVCKTTVPDTFNVLLSQRRRWINSTVHNLMELVLVRDLCGTFCFSMQFVVFIELIGTLVLPAAICITTYLIVVCIIDSIRHLPVPIIPLLLLALILGLPAVLIVLTASRASYVLWMAIYLLSLPLWNGVLPMYAFWKFDDFSWGDTRKTAAREGEGEIVKKGGLEYEGEFDSGKITMKRWGDFEAERRGVGKGGAGGAGGGGQRGSESGWGARQSGYDFM